MHSDFSDSLQGKSKIKVQNDHHCHHIVFMLKIIFTSIGIVIEIVIIVMKMLMIVMMMMMIVMKMMMIGLQATLRGQSQVCRSWLYTNPPETIVHNHHKEKII